MTGQIYNYPKEINSRNRLWVRFKQVDFRLNEQNELLTLSSGTPAVYLYLPGAISTADALNYSADSLDFFGRSVEAAIEGGGLSGQNISERLSGVADSMSAGMDEAVRMAQRIGQGESINAPAAVRILQRFPGAYNSTVGRGVRAATRYAANPHTRSLFESVGLREFSFKFDMLPESPVEAKEIEKIVKFFRLLAYPEYTDVTNISEFRAEGEEDSSDQFLSTFTYKFPSMVKVDMFYMLSDDAQEILNENPDAVRRLQDQDLGSADDLAAGMVRVGPRLQYCHVESINTTYDPNGTQAYLRSGDYVAPPATSLELRVKEDRALHRGMIEAGY